MADETSRQSAIGSQQEMEHGMREDENSRQSAVSSRQETTVPPLITGHRPPTTDHPLGSRFSILRRLFQLWGAHAVLDASLVTQNIRLLVTWYTSDIIINVATISAMLLLAERFAGIGVWSRDQVIFMLGYATLVIGIVGVFFNYNVLMISRRLGRGQLDHTLLQPQPLWMALLTEGFTPVSGSGTLLPGMGLLIWAVSRLGLVATPGWLALLALNLVASVAVMLAFAFLWGSLAFWAPRAAEEVSASAVRMLDELKPFPLDGIGPLLLGGLTTALPVSFLAWYPCRALLGLDQRMWAGFITPLAALILVACTLWVFNQGMKQYGRTGSQRYSNFGHRR